MTTLIDLNVPLHSITHSNWFQSVHASNCESISFLYSLFPRYDMIWYDIWLIIALTIEFKLVDSLKNVTIHCYYPLLPAGLEYNSNQGENKTKKINKKIQKEEQEKKLKMIDTNWLIWRVQITHYHTVSMQVASTTMLILMLFVSRIAFFSGFGFAFPLNCNNSNQKKLLRLILYQYHQTTINKNSPWTLYTDCFPRIKASDAVADAWCWCFL